MTKTMLSATSPHSLQMMLELYTKPPVRSAIYCDRYLAVPYSVIIQALREILSPSYSSMAPSTAIVSTSIRTESQSYPLISPPFTMLCTFRRNFLESAASMLHTASRTHHRLHSLLENHTRCSGHFPYQCMHTASHKCYIKHMTWIAVWTAMSLRPICVSIPLNINLPYQRPWTQWFQVTSNCIYLSRNLIS